MMERHLAEELAQKHRERQAIAAYNASQYIVLALRHMACLPADEWCVNAQHGLAHAHSNLQELLQSLQPKAEKKPKGKGKVIDVEVLTDPFSVALEKMQTMP
jgi:hypothetical protein